MRAAYLLGLVSICLTGCEHFHNQAVETYQSSPVISAANAKLITDEIDDVTTIVNSLGTYDIKGTDKSKPATSIVAAVAALDVCHPHLTALPDSMVITMKFARSLQVDTDLKATAPLPWFILTPEFAETHKHIVTRTVKLPINLVPLTEDLKSPHTAVPATAKDVPERLKNFQAEIKGLLETVISSYMQLDNADHACEHKPKNIDFSTDFEVSDAGAAGLTFTSVVTGSGKVTNTNDATQSLELIYSLAGQTRSGDRRAFTPTTIQGQLPNGTVLTVVPPKP